MEKGRRKVLREGTIYRVERHVITTSVSSQRGKLLIIFRNSSITKVIFMKIPHPVEFGWRLLLQKRGDHLSLDPELLKKSIHSFALQWQAETSKRHPGLGGRFIYGDGHRQGINCPSTCQALKAQGGRFLWACKQKAEYLADFDWFLQHPS